MGFFTVDPVAPDFNAPVTQAKDTAVGLITDNLLVLLAVPIVWVGYKVVRKIIAKIG
ncbi:MAG: hypothetical protein NVV66_01470 [Cellulomonas sp.]|uniref:hypothetical protein n=1 Tax=Cellulomonas sp. TaxID=40001 RepID=UPI00258C86A3|nr:hypothetical protein [Cellulomonas sp.]MCR6703406.1 hypothetical protein [Cellulomonas sp.]